MIILFWITFLIEINIGHGSMNCASSDIHLTKVIGIKPGDANAGLQLYKSSDGKPITIECISRCQNNTDCRSFILYYKTSSCFWYKTEIGAQEYGVVPANDVAWFVKMCLPVKNCGKLWIFDRIPGSILVGHNSKIIPNEISRTECQENCLNEVSFDCKSVKYRIKSANNYGPNAKTTGNCTLSDADRHLLPNSYRASSYNEEYMENQCAKNEDRDKPNEFCSYEEFTNVILEHVDQQFEDKTKEECQNTCDTLKLFNCRGYSLIPSRNSLFTCLIHSEDSKVHGPQLLKETTNGRYFEKARCLNVSIQCSTNQITVRYLPEINFNGRMYMQNFADHPACSVKGNNMQQLILRLSLMNTQCGLTQAHAADNRTLVSGKMILQYNSFIQTQGDRIIRIGCIFGNETTVVLGTGINITDLQNEGSSLVNNSTGGGTAITPEVHMKVVDLYSQGEISDTQIGQDLQLIIECDSSNYDIWAGHLIAMTESGDESIFLLDDRGCPTNLQVFPGLVKYRTNNMTRLVATFQAFRFSSSPIVRFSVIVQFCPGECPTVECGSDFRSLNRQKRQTKNNGTIETINGTTVVNISRSTFEKPNVFYVYKTPLEYMMRVKNMKSYSDKLVYGDNKILVAGFDYTTNEVCIDYSLFIGLIITWIIIQIIFVISCVVLVRKYRNHYHELASRQSLEDLHRNFEFSNPVNRRVHFADNEAYDDHRYNNMSYT